MGRSYPWSLLTFSTAVMTAFSSDNKDKRFGRWQRWIEGGLQGLVMGIAAVITYYWLQELRQETAPNTPFLWKIAALSALNGFLLGCIVPTWYRQACERRVARQDRQDAAQITLVAKPTQTA